MHQRYDILGLGCVAIDDLLYVAQYPPADSKAQVQRHERHCGGLTATALVAAARLGSKCAFAGTLGNDDLSEFVLRRLAEEDIELAFVRQQAGARPIHSFIVVDEGTKSRTIFYDLEGVIGAQPDWPAEELIRSVRVLYVDHFGVEGMIRAAQIARAAGIPVVADFESDQGPGFVELLNLVDHLIISQEFAATLTGENSPSGALDLLGLGRREVLVITCGANGCWYKSQDDPATAFEFPGYPVETMDTTGCGDVFHGAYASALAQGIDVLGRIRFASAAAAIKATRRGGQIGIPNGAAVEAFLKERRS